jgi:hypothetical protein
VRYNHKHTAVCMYNTGHSGQILIKSEYCGQISKIIQISKFMKIQAVVAELLHVNGRTVRYDEANSYYPEFCE